MENSTPQQDKNETIDDAVKNIQKNEQQPLEKENLGNEPEEQPDGDPNNPYRLKGYDDKRPEDESIEKGWTVDSNTSRSPDDLNNGQ